MPYESDAQRRYFNVNKAELEAEGVDVDEWNAASRGKDLPEKKKKTTKRALDFLLRGCGLSRIGSEVGSNSRENGDASVLVGDISDDTQSKQAATKPPVADCNDAIKVAIAVHRRDHLLRGPGRAAWLAKRRMIHKLAFAPPAQQVMGPTSVRGDPATAYAQLMSMIAPQPAVPMAGEGGTGLPTSTPGGEMGAGTRNTPSTNPIGMMSGLGVDPGGRSVMGNAAFGVRNKVAHVDCNGTRNKVAHVKLAYGPYDQRTQDYYAIRRARNLRNRSDQPMTFGQAMGRSGRGMFPDRQLGQASPPGSSRPQTGPIVMVGSHRLTPDELTQWQGLDRGGQRQMAEAIKSRPADYKPPPKAVAAAPTAAPAAAPAGPPSHAALADQMWSRYEELKQQGQSEATAYEIAKREQSEARQGGRPQFAPRRPPTASTYGAQVAQQPSPAAPSHDMAAPAGMTAQQAAVWEQRKGDPQWAAKARAWLQRPQQPQQPQQPQVAQQAPQAPPQGMTAQQAQVWEQRKGDPQWAARARAWLQRPQQPTQQPVAAQSPPATGQVAGMSQPATNTSVGQQQPPTSAAGAKPPTVASAPSPTTFGKRSALAPPAPSTPSATPPIQPPGGAPAQTTGRSRAAINRQLAATPKPAPQRGGLTMPAKPPTFGG
jgi:hypothetical protein